MGSRRFGELAEGGMRCLFLVPFGSFWFLFVFGVWSFGSIFFLSLLVTCSRYVFFLTPFCLEFPLFFVVFFSQV